MTFWCTSWADCQYHVLGIQWWSEGTRKPSSPLVQEVRNDWDYTEPPYLFMYVGRMCVTHAHALYHRKFKRTKINNVNSFFFILAAIMWNRFMLDKIRLSFKISDNLRWICIKDICRAIFTLNFMIYGILATSISY